MSKEKLFFKACQSTSNFLPFVLLLLPSPTPTIIHIHTQYTQHTIPTTHNTHTHTIHTCTHNTHMHKLQTCLHIHKYIGEDTHTTTFTPNAPCTYTQTYKPVYQSQTIYADMHTTCTSHDTCTTELKVIDRSFPLIGL